MMARNAAAGLALVAAFLCLSIVNAAEIGGTSTTKKNGEAGPPSGTEFQLFVENDVWARTDRQYTNGLKIGIGAPDSVLTKFLKQPACLILEKFSGDLADKCASDDFGIKPGNTHFGVFLGQNIYTPRLISVAGPQPNDRPWAAWLYLGVVAQREENNQLQSTEIDVGVVGPAAAGEFVQTEWHKLIGSPKPQGWSNQLGNEPAFMLGYMHKWRKALVGDPYKSFGIDVIPHAGGSFGTVMTMARAGAMVRIGRRMTGYGPDTIEPGGSMLNNTRAVGSVKRTFSERLEWYGFLGIDHRFVVHNIFLNGNVFRGGPGVDHRAHVYDLSQGVTLRKGPLRISINRVRRSEEFSTPVGGGGKQTFHSINAGLEW